MADIAPSMLNIIKSTIKLHSKCAVKRCCESFFYFFSIYFFDVKEQHLVAEIYILFTMPIKMRVYVCL